MAFFRWLSSLFSDKVPCTTCKSSAPFDHQWGRYSVYKCNNCGTVAKVKTYD